MSKPIYFVCIMFIVLHVHVYVSKYVPFLRVSTKSSTGLPTSGKLIKFPFVNPSLGGHISCLLYNDAIYQICPHSPR